MKVGSLVKHSFKLCALEDKQLDLKLFSLLLIGRHAFNNSAKLPSLLIVFVNRLSIYQLSDFRSKLNNDNARRASHPGE